MTREQIKKRMQETIQEHLACELEDLDIAGLVTEDMIYDFLWLKDFGKDIIKAYIDDHTDELVDGYLEEIFDEIDQDDLETPW